MSIRNYGNDSEALAAISIHVEEIAALAEDVVRSTYDGKVDASGVYDYEQFCPMTQMQCMGRNCVAAKKVEPTNLAKLNRGNDVEWRCTAYPNSDVIVDCESGTNDGRTLTERFIEAREKPDEGPTVNITRRKCGDGPVPLGHQRDMTN